MSIVSPTHKIISAPGEPCTRTVSDLIPYALNSKNHPPEQIVALAGLIQDIGFRFPISIDEDNSIIAGHGRLLAAQKLGMTEVPCARHVGLSKREKMALRIADNRLAELAVTNRENLTIELTGLRDEGFDLSIVGFSAADLKGLFENEPEEDAPPNLEDQLHDRWAIMITCDSESEQLQLLERFNGEGLSCRALLG